MSGDRHEVGLERDRRLGQLVQSCSEPAEQIAVGLDDLDAVERARGIHVAAVGRKHDAVGPDRERSVRAVEAGEVADVDGPSDEEAPRAQRRQCGPETRNPIAHVSSFK